MHRMMKIKYNKPEQLIELNDGLKTHNTLINFLMVLNIFNASVNLYTMSKHHFEWMAYIWIVLGVSSLIILIYQLRYKTGLEKIKIDQVEALNEKNFFGKKRFSLKLKNGKSRNLATLNKITEIEALKKMCAEMGITRKIAS